MAGAAAADESSRPSWVLLNMFARVGENHNETTADCYGRNGMRIRASLARERPPLPSNLYVHCAGAAFGQPPRLLSMVDDLIFFHVYIGPPHGVSVPRNTDFFMYRADPNRPSLTLLSHPQGRLNMNNQFGVFPRGEDHYTIAALEPLDYSNFGLFCLSLYDSETRIWSWKKLPIDSPQREFPADIPENSYRPLPHQPSNVLSLGDTIGWVDLKRGIVFCDMLSEKHTLREIPLPLPLKRAEPVSDEVVARSERGIGFVDGRLRLVEIASEYTDDGLPCVYDEETRWPRCRTVNWTITTWSNEEMSNSCDDWQVDCTLQASDFVLSDHSDSEPPPGDLRNLFVSDPTVGLGENDGRVIIYLTARVKFMHPKSWVLAVDTRDRKVQSVIRTSGTLPHEKEMRNIDAHYCDCSISKDRTNASAGKVLREAIW